MPPLATAIPAVGHRRTSSSLHWREVPRGHVADRLATDVAIGLENPDVRSGQKRTWQNVCPMQEERHIG